jgi:hypothetical protein
MLFELPKHTIVNRVIPKNAFDEYTNTKQKKLFVDTIERLKWMNKLSTETINLPSEEIQEIQIFEIELRKKEKIEVLLDLINKSIPYHIIFILSYENEVLVSTSKKHPHPTNDNQSVIDWTFSTEWFAKKNNTLQLNLSGTIDKIFSDLCFQISGKQNLSLPELIKHEEKKKALEKEITRLENAIKKAKQFNEKVNLNNELQKVNKILQEILIQCRS